MVRAALAADAIRQNRKERKRDTEPLPVDRTTAIIMAREKLRQVKFRNRLRNGALLTGGTIITVIVGVHFYNKWRKAQSEKNALDGGSGARFALRIKMAFENDYLWGWGVDTDALFKALEDIPDRKTMLRTEAAYFAQNNTPLAADLKDELSIANFEKATGIIDLVKLKT